MPLRQCGCSLIYPPNAPMCVEMMAKYERDDRAGYPHCRFTWPAEQSPAGDCLIRGVDEWLVQEPWQFAVCSIPSA